MGWNDRLGLLSDEDVEGYLAAVDAKANAEREQPPFPPIDPED